VKGILKLGFKLLVNDRAKFSALILGIVFAVYLMMFVTSMFFGVLNHASANIINVGSTIWVMDPYVESVSNSVGMPNYVLDAVRSMHGVKYAVPLYSGGALVKLADGNYQPVTVVGLDDTSLLGRPALLEGKIEDIYAENGFIVVRDAEFSKLENPHIGSEFELNDNRAVIVGIARVRANVYAAQASAADLENVRLSEQAELAADYYELRAQDSLEKLLASTVAAYQEMLDLTQSQYRAGLCSDESVAQAEAQLRAAQAEDTDLGVLRAQYEHAIAVLIGQPASTFALPAHALETKPPATPVGIPSELLERRPDIAAAERAVAQANAQIGVAKAAYFPNVLLSGSAGFGNSSVSSWFTWPSRFWSVGPSISETIFDAGLRRATVQQSRAYYDQTVANYRQTVLTAFQQVENNLASLRILSQAIGRQDAAVEAATRSLHEATVRYKTGVDPYVNVITAQTILLNDQQTAVNYRMQEMVASVQLIKALGGGWNAAQIPSPKEIRAGTERSSVSMHENN